MRHAVRRAYRVRSAFFGESELNRSLFGVDTTRVSSVGRDNMTGNNYYCAGDQCRKTTRRLCVRMRNRTYYYCVNCGRRLELRDDLELRARKAS